MLGKCIKDPYGVESGAGKAKGLGLLDVETILEREKKIYQVKATIQSGVRSQESGVKGYEIHMGETIGGSKPFANIAKRNGASVRIEDGAVSDNGRIWGTYIHGIFDNDAFRTGLLSEIRAKRSLHMQGIISFQDKKDQGIRKLAEVVNKNIDIQRLFHIINSFSDLRC